jgi:transposase
VKRSFGLDVHLDFCEVAVWQDGEISQLGRIASTPEAIEEFAAGLRASDQVALEASCGAMRIARLLREGAVGRVVVCNAMETRAIYQARAKSDRFDAGMLAKLVAGGMLAEVWQPDEATSELRRRVARRAGLVRARTRVKNEVHAVLARCLLGRPPVSDLFGKRGRAWLAELQLPEEEAQTTQSCLRHIDFLNGEVAELDQRIAKQALAMPGFHRLLTIPGVDVGTAAAVIGAVGEISRFSRWLQAPRSPTSGARSTPPNSAPGPTCARDARIGRWPTTSPRDDCTSPTAATRRSSRRSKTGRN